MAITNPFETDLMLSRNPHMHEERTVLGSGYLDAIDAGRIVLDSGGFFWICLQRGLFSFPDYSCRADFSPASSAILGDRCASPGRSLYVQFCRVLLLRLVNQIPAVSYEWSESRLRICGTASMGQEL
jgi:hypothetical protein